MRDRKGNLGGQRRNRWRWLRVFDDFKEPSLGHLQSAALQPFPTNRNIEYLGSSRPGVSLFYLASFFVGRIGISGDGSDSQDAKKTGVGTVRDGMT